MNRQKSPQITLLLTVFMLLAGGAILFYALVTPNSFITQWVRYGLEQAIDQAKQLPQPYQYVTVTSTKPIYSIDIGKLLPQQVKDYVSLKKCQYDENQRVKAEIQQAIDQKSNYLTLQLNCLTTLPPEIGQLTQLKELQVWGYHNNLTTLPPEIGQLAELEELSVWNIQLISLPPEIKYLRQLKKLYLHNNQLTTLPPEIVQLTGLELLSVWGNHLTILPREIGQLVQLKHLDIIGNQFTILPPEIEQLTHLKGLYLDKNLLTTIPPEIKAMPHLQIVGP